MFFTLSETETPDSLKSQFRRLSKIHHPDLGGREENFVALQGEYENLLANLRRPSREEKPSKKRKFERGILKFYRLLSGEGLEHSLRIPSEGFREGCVVFLMVHEKEVRIRISSEARSPLISNFLLSGERYIVKIGEERHDNKQSNVSSGTRSRFR